MRPTNNDSLQIGGEYLHTKFDSFVYPAGGAVAGLTTACGVTPATPFPIIDCSGRPLPRAPKFSGTASYTQTFQLAGAGRIDATVATQFSSSRYLTIDFTDASRARGFATLDANLTWPPTIRSRSMRSDATSRTAWSIRGPSPSRCCPASRLPRWSHPAPMDWACPPSSSTPCNTRPQVAGGRSWAGRRTSPTTARQIAPRPLPTGGRPWCTSPGQGRSATIPWRPRHVSAPCA